MNTTSFCIIDSIVACTFFNQFISKQCVVCCIFLLFFLVFDEDTLLNLLIGCAVLLNKYYYLLTYCKHVKYILIKIPIYNTVSIIVKMFDLGILKTTLKTEKRLKKIKRFSWMNVNRKYPFTRNYKHTHWTEIISLDSNAYVNNCLKALYTVVC